MPANSELQLNKLSLSCPILLSKADYMPTKFIDLTVKLNLDTAKVNQTDSIQDTVCFLSLKNSILAYSASLKEPIYIGEYGQCIIDMIHSMSLEDISAQLKMEVFEHRSLVKSICYIMEHINGNTRASLLLKHIECKTKVGCTDLEKEQPQRLLLGLSLQFPTNHITTMDINVSDLIMDIRSFLEGSYYNTLECLTNRLAHYIEQQYGFTGLELCLQKTSSIAEVFSTGVKLCRTTSRKLHRTTS